MTDMRHMDYLQSVVDEDVRVLHEKESTYRGSWKAAGGRSAWFMARRNLDRLIVMMEKYEATLPLSVMAALADRGETVITMSQFKDIQRQMRSEDIFAKIEESPGGEDGTVLAVMRDARRYFTLVEAEMMARGVVARPELREPSIVSELDEILNRKEDGDSVNLQRPQYEKRDEALEAVGMGAARTRVLDDRLWPRPYDGTKDDKVPWPTVRVSYVRDDLKIEDYFVVDRRRHVQDHLPILKTELNHKEHGDTPPEYRGMYSWRESDSKWVLDEQWVEYWTS